MLVIGISLVVFGIILFDYGIDITTTSDALARDYFFTCNEDTRRQIQFRMAGTGTAWIDPVCIADYFVGYRVPFTLLVMSIEAAGIGTATYTLKLMMSARKNRLAMQHE